MLALSLEQLRKRLCPLLLSTLAIYVKMVNWCAWHTYLALFPLVKSGQISDTLAWLLSKCSLLDNVVFHYLLSLGRVLRRRELFL
jgi:hypothetical protein